MGFQQTIITGNIGRDAETRSVGESTVCNFSVAVSEKYKSRDGSQQESTTWFRCALWGPRAEALARYLTKGTSVTVAGKIKTRQYEKDGQTRDAWELNVREIAFAGGKRDNGGGTGGSSGGRQPGGGGYPEDDYGTNTDDTDLPF